jgi:hypothetical protein
VPSDWERVAADPELLAALRRHDAGPDDPLDRLWWAEHPGEPTPAGLPDPSRGIEEARRALYRPDASPSAADEVERAREADADSVRSVRRALAAADLEVLGVAPSARSSVGARPARRTILGAVVAAVLIGAAGGWAAGRFTAGPPSSAPTVFARAQQPDDRPPAIAELPHAVVPASTRLLGSSSASGTSMYAARTVDDRVCLLAVVLARYVVGSCTTASGFARAGLSLTFPTTVDPQDDSGPAAPQQLSPTWSPEGDLTF